MTYLVVFGVGVGVGYAIGHLGGWLQGWNRAIAEHGPGTRRDDP